MTNNKMMAMIPRKPPIPNNSSDQGNVSAVIEPGANEYAVPYPMASKMVIPITSVSERQIQYTVGSKACMQRKGVSF